GPADLAVQAARSAVLLRDHLPGAKVVLATGHGVVDARGPAPVGQVIDRAAALLRAAEPAGAGQQRRTRPPWAPRRLPVPVDEVPARLIEAHFDVRGEPPRLELHGEGEAGVARTLLGRAMPFVGRERELRALEGLYDECVAESVARAALVTAPAG